MSLADKTHNASAILGDYRELGDELWDRFNGGWDGTIWYCRSLSEVFDKVVPGPLADRFHGRSCKFASSRRMGSSVLVSRPSTPSGLIANSSTVRLYQARCRVYCLPQRET